MADAILAQCGIYQIRNTVNGKIYIGSTSRMTARWRSHKHDLNRNEHANARLQHSWRKHKAEAFDFTVIEGVTDLDDLLLREQFWIDSLSSWSPTIGYNICRIAGSTRGTKRTPETCEKIATKARMRPPPSAETRAKISAAGLGRIRSPESIEKSRLTRTGEKLSSAHIESMRISQTGKKLSDATKQKIGDSLRAQWANGQRVSNFVVGRKMSPEAVAKVAAAHRGMKRSAETKAKMSEHAKNRRPGHNEKMAASLTGRKLSAGAIAKREATRRLNGNHIPSDATRKKRSDATKGRKKTPEQIANSVAGKLAKKLARLAQPQ